jgi:hypothetical protein
MTLLRWLLRIVAAGVALLALLFLAARLHDGPLGPLPGGALEAGEEVTVPVTDGRAMLRIDGKRYPVELSKLDDAAADAIAVTIQSEVERKYGRAPPSDAGVWLFRVASRAPAS